MPTISELVERFERFWPTAHADDWDPVGLVAGSGESKVNKVLVSVDLTGSVIDEAVRVGANMIVTHHPVLLRAVHSVSEDELKGGLLTKLIGNNIACYSAHTNADVQTDGASSLMAKSFGLKKLRPLIKQTQGFGHGVIGELPAATSLAEFAKVVSKALPRVSRKIVFSGNPQMPIKRVAICSGSGDGFLPQAIASNVDVYVTSDLRHHPAQDAISTPRPGREPLALVDVSHWAAESLWVEGAVKRLGSIRGISAIASKISTDPWTREVN